MNVNFDFALLAPNAFQPSIPPFLSPFKPRNFFFQRNKLGTRVLEFLNKSNDTQTCIFELVDLVIDTFVSTVKFSLEAADFGDQRRDGRVVSCVIQP
jgi:hypothetical protein